MQLGRTVTKQVYLLLASARTSPKNPNLPKEINLLRQVRALPGVGFRLEAELTGMGLACAADVRALPRGALVQRFGERVGAFLHEACRGEDSSAVKASGPPKAITVEARGSPHACDAISSIF